MEHPGTKDRPEGIRAAGRRLEPGKSGGLLVELREFWKAVSRQWFAALIAFGLCAAGVAYLAFSPPNQYRASATVSVEPAALSSGTSDVQVVNFLMPALQAQVETATFDRTVRDASPRVAASHYNVTSSISPGTGLLVITAESNDSQAVAVVANTFASTLIASSPSPGLRIRVLAPAQRPAKPQGPHRLTILISGLILALIIAVIAALFAHAAHRRRTRGDEIRDSFGLPVLGEIPVIRRFRGTTFVQLFERVDDPAIEAFVKLRTNVELALARHRITSVCVTSHRLGVGKSTISGSMSYAMASVGHRVTLIEGDLRRPSLSPGFALAPMRQEPGLAGRYILVEAHPETPFRFVSAEDLRQLPIQGIQRPGQHPADTVSTALPELLAESAAGDLSVVDAPPISTAETKLIVSLSRWAIVVVDAHRRDALDNLEDTVNQVREAGGEVLGIVLNRARVRRAQRRANEYTAHPAQTGGRRVRHRQPLADEPV
jgi:polysaccharide biosynthesis transport protein